METDVLLKRIEALEKQILKVRNNDVKTKYQTVALFRNIKKNIGYRIPKKQINVSEDGRYFQCPTCRIMYETELDYKADDFNCCPNCGQLFKEVRENE